MQLEFHQLDRRLEHLRVRHPSRQRRLLASLADSRQQTPIVVVAAEGQADRYWLSTAISELRLWSNWVGTR
jgi:hypothetical protein